MGLNRQVLREFIDKGVGRSIKFLDVEGLSYITTPDVINPFTSSSARPSNSWST